MAGIFRYTVGGDYSAADSSDITVRATFQRLADFVNPGRPASIAEIGIPGLPNVLEVSQYAGEFAALFRADFLTYLRSNEVGLHLNYANGNNVANFSGGDFGDVLVGGALSDTLRGHGGDDTLTGNAGDDFLIGSGGFDTANYAAEDGTGDVIVNLSGSFAGVGPTLARDSFGSIDSLSLIEHVRTGDGDDRVYGSSDANTIRTGAGEDLLSGGNGNDRLDGGDGADAMTGGFGNDTFHLDDASDAVNELAGGGVDTVVTQVSSTVLGENVERLTLAGAALIGIGNDDANTLTGNVYGNRLSGADGDDRLAGGDGGDDLFGGADNDRLIGGAGEDILTGGGGNDVLIGGADADWFVFRVANEGADRIADFEMGIDTIVLDIALFGAPLPPGGIADLFEANATGAAAAPDDLVLYNTRNGALWFDADGSGAGAAILLARLSRAPDVTAADIFIGM